MATTNLTDDINRQLDQQERLRRLIDASAFVAGQLLGFAHAPMTTKEQCEAFERAAVCLGEAAELTHPVMLDLIAKYRKDKKR